MSRLRRLQRGQAVEKIGRPLLAVSLVAGWAGALPGLSCAQGMGAPADERLAQAQAALRLISEDLGSVAAYKPMMAAGSTGRMGLDIGTAVLFNQVRNRDLLGAGLGGGGQPADVPAALPQTALRVNKGLPWNGSGQPWNLDAGFSLSRVLGSDLIVVGGDVRWGLLEERRWLPGLSVRLAATRMLGVDQLALKTASYDVALSKTFYLFTPYAGVGEVAVSAASAAPGLQAEDFMLLHAYAGINMTVRNLTLLMEVDRTGEAANLGMKLGLRY